jgi:hypothetical protein
MTVNEDTLTAHLAERDCADAVHRELTQALLAGGGFDRLLRILSIALGRPVTVVDVQGRLVAASAQREPGAPPAVAPEVRAAIAAAAESGRCQVVDTAATSAVAALRAGSRDLGALLLGGNGSAPGPADRMLVERAAQLFALLELQQRTIADAAGRSITDLVSDILDPRGDSHHDDLERRARGFGVALGRLDTVQLYAVPAERRAAACTAAREHVGRRGLVGRTHGVVAVLLDSRRADLPAHELREHIRRRAGGGVLAVVPPPAESADDLPERFTVALRTNRLLSALGVTDGVAGTDEYLPYASVFDADTRSLRSFIDGLIGAVLAYDEERGTELVATLRAFVRSNASPTRTARLLRFHTNTILQRLDRLDALLGRGWREDDRFFRISVAARLHEMHEKLHEPSEMWPAHRGARQGDRHMISPAG